jgi:metal-responsive CopG/Arc/MetJ family transcriptional regulator
MKTIQTEVPDKLYQELQAYVQGGWFSDEGEVLREALRRYVDAHRPDLMEQFIRTDVEWGLRGRT